MRTYRSGTLLKDETLAEAPVWLRDKSLKWHLIQYVSVSNQHATHLKLIQYDNDYLRRAGFGGRGENGTWLRSGKSMLCKSTNCQKKKKKRHIEEEISPYFAMGENTPLFHDGEHHRNGLPSYLKKIDTWESSYLCDIVYGERKQRVIHFYQCSQSSMKLGFLSFLGSLRSRVLFVYVWSFAMVLLWVFLPSGLNTTPPLRDLWPTPSIETMSQLPT